jgi:predicted NUDIX family NTP pyrophosphohydrolase
LVPLGSVENSTRKVVHVFAVEVDFDLNRPVLSNFFEIEWPPNSGKMQQFPEVDKFGYYSLAEARQKLTPYQVPMVDRLLSIQQSEGSGTF